jgi:lipopolysaccharide biosynthesis glycosyltransferase
MASRSPALMICFDDHYAPAACVMMTSFLANNRGSSFELYAITEHVRPVNREIIEELCLSHGRKIHFLEFDPQLYRSFEGFRHISRAAYLRIFGPQLIDASRIVYLDVDLIVQTDLTPLADFDMNGNLVLGALDNTQSVGLRNRIAISVYEPYINTGVLVIDADAWRKNDTTSKLVDYYETHKRVLYWADQDLINACLSGQIGVLEQNWNTLYGDIISKRVSGSDFAPELFRGIFHFNTTLKPWTAQTRQPYRELYEKYARISPLRMPETDSSPSRLIRKIWKLSRRLARRTTNWQSRLLEDRRVRRLFGGLHGESTIGLGYSQPDFSIHMVVSSRDVELALWSLKSFSWSTRLSPAVFLHDDGSLTGRDRERLFGHLAGCTIVSRREGDVRAAAWLRNHPLCQRARATPGFYCALKLFDPWIYAPNNVVLLLDSDVLFFRHPTELLIHLGNRSPCFGSDYQNAYSATPEELRQRLGFDILQAVNAGLVVMPKEVFDLDLVERYFATALQPAANRDEQTICAALLSRAGASRLDRAYQISIQSIEPETVSHHFVSDGSRPRFWTRGVPLLLMQRLKERLARRGWGRKPVVS